MSLKSKLKQKGALSEFRCDICDNPICECILDRIRQQENAMIVARQAIETQDHLNITLTKEVEELRAENKELKDKVQNKFWKDIDNKKSNIDKQYQRFENRSRLIQ